MSALADRRRGVLAAIDRAVSGSETNVLDRTARLLHDNFAQYSWVGIYRRDGDELVLGPWAGPEAPERVRIPLGLGIHGVALQSGRVLVADDATDPEHEPASFAWSRSEIAVPIVLEQTVIGEIAIASDTIAAFDGADHAFLERVARTVSRQVPA